MKGYFMQNKYTLEELEKRIGYQFHDRTLLKQSPVMKLVTNSFLQFFQCIFILHEISFHKQSIPDAARIHQQHTGILIIIFWLS